MNIYGPVINYVEGYTKVWVGGQVKFYPYAKGGGAEKDLAMPKEWTQSFRVVSTQVLSFSQLAIQDGVGGGGWGGLDP